MAMLTVLAQQSVAVQVHIASIAVVMALTPLQLWRGRRDRWHRWAGYIWVLAMTVAAIGSFWISELRHVGPFSAVHLLSIYVLSQLYLAIRAARAGRIEEHRIILQSMSLFALVGAGAFTFLPGRTMNRMFFPDAPLEGFVAILCVALAIFGVVGWRRYVRRLQP